MIHGGCLCGAVRYEIAGELGPIVCCHCPQCRKAQGSAFGTNSPVKVRDFRLVSGEEKLAAFQSSPGKWRCFCSVCGSPILSRRDNRPEVLRLRVGTLDAPVDAKPVAHIYVASKADWYDILDDTPRHPGEEPGR